VLVLVLVLVLLVLLHRNRGHCCSFPVLRRKECDLPLQRCNQLLRLRAKQVLFAQQRAPLRSRRRRPPTRLGLLLLLPLLRGSSCRGKRQI
jgi:hypothetical protein